MKKKSLFAISLMSMALVACSNDEDVNKVIDQENEGGALVTLKLDVAKPQTKGSPGATNKQPGTEAENAIDNVTVVVDYGKEKKYFTSTTEGVTWDTTNKKLSFEAPEGEATFYVYANTNTADPVGTSWAANLVSKGTVSDYYKANNFFMSNQDGEGQEYMIQPTGENNVTVNIERAAAKVTVESGKTFTDTESGGTMKSMKFTLGNMVDKFYLLQQTPISIPTDVQYLPDGNANTNAWIDVELGKTVSGSGTETVDKTSLTGAYCMENIQPNYQEGNTTYAKFQTEFTPGKAVKIEEVANATEGANKYKVGTELKEVEAPAEGANLPTFYVVLEGNQDIIGNYLMKEDIYTGTDPKKDITVTAVKNDEEETIAYTVTGIDGISKISLPYEEGKCFFGPIWFNTVADKKQSPVYRNDWYHLTVKSIKLPGSPKEPDGEGTDPINQDANITVTATVLDWEWEARDIELQ